MINSCLVCGFQERIHDPDVADNRTSHGICSDECNDIYNIWSDSDWIQSRFTLREYHNRFYPTRHTGTKCICPLCSPQGVKK